MSSNNATSAAFQFSPAHRGQMLAVLGTIKDIMQGRTPNLHHSVWDSRSSDVGRSRGPYGKVSRTTDTLIFFGDEPGWLMELDRRERILPINSGKHIRIDELHKYRYWDKVSTSQLATNMIMPLFRNGFSGNHRIWTITPPNDSFNAGQLASVIHSVFSGQDTFRNVSFEQIELGSSNDRAGEKHHLIEAHWILKNMPMIPKWPQYGPRYPQSMWSTTSYAKHFSLAIRHSQYFTATLMSLLQDPSTAGTAGASRQSNANNRIGWNETARKSRAASFRITSRLPVYQPVRSAQQAGSKQVQGQGSNILRRI